MAERLHRHQELYKEAKLAWAARIEKIPKECKRHDGGESWRHYHWALFDLVNPSPADQVAQPVGRHPNTTRTIPHPLRREDVVEDNNLQVCQTPADIRRHMARFPDPNKYAP